jgi:hypothetical protein
MRTKYLGIESICVITKDLEATIACNIMFEGHNYDTPIYTNIFCHFVHLREFLKIDNSALSKHIASELENQVINSNKEMVQIDLPSYYDNNIEWKFPISVNLIEIENHPSGIQCYQFDIDEIRNRLGEQIE